MLTPTVFCTAINAHLRCSSFATVSAWTTAVKSASLVRAAMASSVIKHPYGTARRGGLCSVRGPPSSLTADEKTKETTIRVLGYKHECRGGRGAVVARRSSVPIKLFLHCASTKTVERFYTILQCRTVAHLHATKVPPHRMGEERPNPKHILSRPFDPVYVLCTG